MPISGDFSVFPSNTDVFFFLTSDQMPKNILPRKVFPFEECEEEKKNIWATSFEILLCICSTHSVTPLKLLFVYIILFSMIVQTTLNTYIGRMSQSSFRLSLLIFFFSSILNKLLLIKNRREDNIQTNLL